MGNIQLSKGSQEKEEVKKLQTLLNKYGANLGVDGIFGDKTEAAVKNYQKSVGLGQDGIVGVKTWAKLNENNIPASNTAGHTDRGGLIQSGISDAVKYGKENAPLIKPTYQVQWDTQLNDTINKILGREKFEYDLNGDALYQQYKDKHIKQGKMAMADAVGQASAMTGGYGNSYAQSVGQQAYNAQLENLNDIIPELYQMAYDRHNQETQDLYNQYALLGAEQDREYGKYRDEMSDYFNERDFEYGKEINSGKYVLRGVTDSIKEKASKFETNDELALFLDTLEESEIISPQEADGLWADYRIEDKGQAVGGDQGSEEEIEDPWRNLLKEGEKNEWDDWDVEADGGTNWFWGIDNNAKVRAPNKESVTMKELFDKLVDEGMSEKSAKKAIKDLQEALKI